MAEKLFGDILRESYDDRVERAKCTVADFIDNHKKDMMDLAKAGRVVFKVDDKNEINALLDAYHKIPNFPEYITTTYGLNVIIFQGGIGRDYLNKFEFSWGTPASVDNCLFTAER